MLKHIVKTLQMHPWLRVKFPDVDKMREYSTIVQAREPRVSNVHTSLRQASEWGMRGLQGTFPCCKKRLPSDSVKHRLVIEGIILVHNYRTHTVGQNQIKAVFDSEYARVVNLEGYDRISQYYFHPGDYNTDSNEEDNSSGDDEDGEVED
jgi:hypothetical protein